MSLVDAEDEKAAIIFAMAECRMSREKKELRAGCACHRGRIISTF